MSQQPIPPDIQRHFLDPLGVSQVSPLAPGLSGALVFRCQGDESLVLRRWPKGTAEKRIRQIHLIVKSLAYDCRLIPGYRQNTLDGQTYLTDLLGYIWDLSTWMDGHALDHDASIDQISRGARQLGHIHRRFSELGVWQQPIPAVGERIRRLNELTKLVPLCSQVSPFERFPGELVEALRDASRLIQSEFFKAAKNCQNWLSSLTESPRPTHYVLRDIHREHMLFLDGQVSGIIDLDAIRVDTSAVDIARWATSFEAFRLRPGEVLDQVLAEYVLAGNGGVESLSVLVGSDTGFGEIPSPQGHLGYSAYARSPEFRTLVEMLAVSTTWISLGNWVVWLLGEARQFPDLPRVAIRVRRLIESAEALAKR